MKLLNARYRARGEAPCQLRPMSADIAIWSLASAFGTLGRLSRVRAVLALFLDAVDWLPLFNTENRTVWA